MRIVIVVVAMVGLAAALAVRGGARPADAAEAAAHAGARAAAWQGQQQVDEHEDSRVPVQLVVFGAAAMTVVVAGTAAYVLRRRLGLTAYDPKEAEAKLGH